MPMTNITLAVPPELHAKMKRFRDVRWSEVARRAIAERVADLEAMDALAANSRLTKRDVQVLSKMVNRAATKSLSA